MLKEQKYRRYTITKNTQFGSLINKLTTMLEQFKNNEHIITEVLKKDRLEVSATIYGYTILRLEFFHPYFTITEGDK